MKKLLASIIVLIITTTISFTHTEVDSKESVETYEIKKDIISTNTLAATHNHIKY